MDNASIRASLGRNPAEDHHVNRKNNKKTTNPIKLILSVIVVAVIVFAGLLIYRSSTSSTINSSQYQAVFLSNGQVYFGKLKVINGDYMSLTDIYYLQTTTPEDTTETTINQDTNTTDVELIKLGEEIHGPEDEMLINKTQILFYENIKDKGSVTSSIKQYQESLNQ